MIEHDRNAELRGLGYRVLRLGAGLVIAGLDAASALTRAALEKHVQGCA